MRLRYTPKNAYIGTLKSNFIDRMIRRKQKNTDKNYGKNAILQRKQKKQFLLRFQNNGCNSIEIRNSIQMSKCDCIEIFNNKFLLAHNNSLNFIHDKLEIMFGQDS